MKIFQMIADGNPGGGIQIVLSLCKELIKNNHTVYLAIQKNSYGFFAAQDLNVNVIPINFFKSVFSYSLKNEIRKACNSIKPDVVHVHGSRAAFHVSRCKINFSSIYTVHGYHFIKQNFIRRTLGRFAEKRNSKIFDCTTFVCKYDLNNSQKYNIVKSTTFKKVIHNGINVDSLPLKKNNNDPKTVVFLGRLSYPKDPALFLDVFKRLVDKGYRAKIIGGGELEVYINKKIRRHNLEHYVTVTGKLPHEKAMEMLSEAHCMIMTSRWEGFPVSILEAMAMGIPVIAPNINGIPEIIEHKKNGLLVDTRRPIDFANSVEYIEGPKKYLKISTNAEQTVRENFTVEKMYQKYMTIYQRNK